MTNDVIPTEAELAERRPLLTTAQRRDMLRRLPFVHFRERSTACSGVLWSRVPRRARWDPKTHRPQPPALLDLWRCKKPAHWRFTALKRSLSQDGVYCMTHLLAQLYDDYDEEKRANRWYKKLLPKVLGEE